jgi:hypothetical protein
VKRIRNCSKEGPGSFPRRDNHINAKIGWDHLKFFSRTTEPEELIFTGKLSDIMYIQVCSSHGPMGAEGATIE